MKLKPPLIAALLVLGGRACMAQAISPDVIASSGSCFVSPEVSLSWTLGEPLSETDASSTNYLTQGFQQPTSVIITSVNNINQQGNVSAYPNPFTSSFYVKNNGEGKSLEVELIDMDGKTIFKKSMTAQEQEFDLSPYANGIYFLKVYNVDNQLIQTLKVDKIK
jgi:hypothetical protein